MADGNRLSELMKVAQGVRRRLVKRTGRETLRGYCAIASYRLYRAALARDIPCIFCMGEFSPEQKFEQETTHCWVQIGSEFVDPTATQFGDFPPILVSAKSDPRYCTHFTGDDAIRQFSQWPQEQNPVHQKRLPNRV